MVSDLSVLRGKPIRFAALDGSINPDLAPLRECLRLEDLILPASVRNLEMLRGHPTLKRMAWGSMANWAQLPPVEEFWRQYDLDPRTPDQRREELMPLKGKIEKAILAAGSTAEEIVLRRDLTFAVKIKAAPNLSDLSFLKGFPISVLQVTNCAVRDLEPLREMPLVELRIWNTKVEDLSRLAGKRMTSIDVSGTLVRDLTLLRGMPLRELRLQRCANLTDLSALREMTTLEVLLIPAKVGNVEFLRDLPKLRILDDKVPTAGSPGSTPAEFFMRQKAP